MENGQRIFSEDDVLLFTTSTCPKCPSAKKWLTDNKIDYILIVADENEDNMKLAEALDIINVPTISVNFQTYTLEEFKAEIKNGTINFNKKSI